MSSAIKSITSVSFLSGERSSSLDELPLKWQEIAEGRLDVGTKNVELYVELARLFHYKMVHGDVELFDNPDCAALRRPFSSVMGTLANEALSFYADDFLINRYPQFSELRAELRRAGAHQDKLVLVDAVEDMFKTLSYDVPASFYEAYLSAIYSANISDSRFLRFEPESKDVARKWDAILHATGEAYALSMFVQGVASQHGLRFNHLRGCNKPVSFVSDNEKYVASLPSDNTDVMAAFFWFINWQYAVFPISPSTQHPGI